MTTHIQAPYCFNPRATQQGEILSEGEIYSLDLETREWWDRTNGVTYASGRLIVNYSRGNEIVVYFGFEGSCNQRQIEHYAMIWLHGAIHGKAERRANGTFDVNHVWHYSDTLKIPVRDRVERVGYRVALAFGKAPSDTEPPKKARKRKAESVGA